MAKLALYRAWRPQIFDDVVSQHHIVSALKQAVINQDFAHAYLFTGIRGTGKTSMAKILARAVNCENPKNGNPCNECDSCTSMLSASLLDVQEIDAASNNSVSNIREIVDDIIYAPVKTKYKVYIIDEVHMLSTGAFNALLKTLEEPPAHALFILATTEPHRIPATILSRCQRYDFRRIPDDELVERLRKIATAEDITIDDEALTHIASVSDGAMRDAISLLDQCKLSNPEGTDLNNLMAMIGSVDKLFCANIVRLLLAAKADEIFMEVERILADGKDVSRLATDLSSFLRDLLVLNLSKGSTTLVQLSHKERIAVMQLLPHLNNANLTKALLELQELLSQLRWSYQARLSLELCLLKILPLFQNGKTGLESSSVTIPTDQAKSEPTQLEKAKIEQAKLERIQLEEVKLEQTHLTQDKATFTAVSDTSSAMPNGSPVSDTCSAMPNGSATLLSLWNKFLENLESLDLYFYLFAKDGRAELSSDQGIDLHYAVEFPAHYNVMISSPATKVHELWADFCHENGQKNCKLKVVYDGHNEAAISDDTLEWIDRLKRIAEKHSIPLKEELHG